MLAQTLCEKRGGVQKEETTITFKSKFTRQSHSSLIVELLQRQWRMRNVFFFSPLWGFWVSVSGAFLFMCLFRFFFACGFFRVIVTQFSCEFVLVSPRQFCHWLNIHWKRKRPPPRRVTQVELQLVCYVHCTAFGRFSCNSHAFEPSSLPTKLKIHNVNFTV